MILNNFNEAMTYAAASEPFRIEKAILYTYGKKQGDIYFLGMRGTDQSFDPNDLIGLPTCAKAALTLDNNYFRAVKSALLTEVPAGSDVVIVAHSLGGMVAQQLAADDEVKNHCNFLNILTIGSPFVPVHGRACPLRRIADVGDAVPLFTPVGVLTFFLGGGVKRENGGYLGHFVLAHTDSYRYSQKWFKYDVFGNVNGGHTVEIIG